MHKFFYYTIRVRNIYNNTYSLSCKGNIVHYSTIFKPNPYYRKRDKKWKIGWRGSEWRIPRKYKEEYREREKRKLNRKRKEEERGKKKKNEGERKAAPLEGNRGSAGPASCDLRAKSTCSPGRGAFLQG